MNHIVQQRNDQHNVRQHKTGVDLMLSFEIIPLSNQTPSKMYLFFFQIHNTPPENKFSDYATACCLHKQFFHLASPNIGNQSGPCDRTS